MSQPTVSLGFRRNGGLFDAAPKHHDASCPSAGNPSDEGSLFVVDLCSCKRFVDLPYPFIKLEEDDTVAQLVPLSSDAGCGLPIAYFNRPLTRNTRIIFSFEGNAGFSRGDLICRIGLTSCNPSNLSKHSFHFNDMCKAGGPCGGLSTSLPIYKYKSHAVVVMLEQVTKRNSRQVGLAVLTTHYSDEVKSCTVKDKSRGSKMSSVPLYPFIVLNGMASRVRVRSETFGDTRIARANARSATRRLRPFPRTPINNESPQVRTTDSWLVGNGIEVCSQSFTRKFNGSHFCICKDRLMPGQVYIFNISLIEQALSGDTFTIGYTTHNISGIDPNQLPPLTDKFFLPEWYVYRNVLPAVMEEDEIRIRVTESAVIISSRQISSRPVVRNYPASAHLFLYMTPNILIMKHRRDIDQAEAAKTRPNQEGSCIVCCSARADHMLLPCSHLCLCGGCLLIHRTSSDGNRCPICRQIVRSRMSVFLT